jgi:hypothetical protein
LRTRAQVFEILTGGGPTADDPSDSSWQGITEEGPDSTTSLVPLPQDVLDDLKVDLAVRGE